MYRKLTSVLTALIAVSVAWAATPRMRIHVINVGQGSATLLEFKCGAVLVDTGAAPDTNPNSLKEYLDAFFRLRPDLNNTLKAVYLTHCHADHAYGLGLLASNYNVERFIDGGIRTGSGKNYVKKFLEARHALTPALIERVIDDSEIRNLPAITGLTDANIDPLRCDDCDPTVLALSGGHLTKPDGWTNTAFGNLNNQSLTLRFALGKSSVLISGDLETEGLNRLTTYYQPTNLLDSDILVAGHHGADNGISAALLQETTPKIGVISCGQWTDGKNSTSQFTTWAYGHPRKSTVQMLQSSVSRSRTPVTEKVATGARKFEDFKVNKAIYCTGWDGSIVIDAYASGTINVHTSGLSH